MIDQNSNPLDIIQRLPEANLTADVERAVQSRLEQNGYWDKLSEREKKLVILGAVMGAKEGWKHHTSQLIRKPQTESSVK